MGENFQGIKLIVMSFDFNKDYILEDDIAFLRPLLNTDIGLLIPYAINEPKTWKYFITEVSGKENLQRFISFALYERRQKRQYPFAVFDKRKNKIAGSTRFYDIQLFHKTLQVGFTWYGEEFRGTGLNKHCKYLLFNFAFEDMNMERIELRADVRNQRSINAMKSLGCKVEGVLRSNSACENGERRDSIILSILRKEWYGEIKELLKNKL